MQPADIEDDVFIAAVATTPWHRGHPWRFRDDVQATLERMLGFEVPEELFLIKARKMGEEQKLEGCTDCPCRGDYHLPRECYQFNCCYAVDFDWRTHPQWDESWVDNPITG